MLRYCICYLSLLLLLFNTGCRSLSNNQSIKTNSDISNQQFAPAVLYPSNIQKEYRINPIDLIEISVYQEADLTKLARVSQDGFITYPLIGKVKVDGYTVIEAEKVIADLLEKDFLVDPQVTIFIKEYHSKKVVIMGEVKNPGSYEFPQGRELTVLEAIALSGGFSDIASVDKTKVIRVENGVQQHIQVKISDITQGGDKSKNINLKPDDIVFVPERIF